VRAVQRRRRLRAAAGPDLTAALVACLGPSANLGLVNQLGPLAAAHLVGHMGAWFTALLTAELGGEVVGRLVGAAAAGLGRHHGSEALQGEAVEAGVEVEGLVPAGAGD
jgi:hypothetical protein